MKTRLYSANTKSELEMYKNYKLRPDRLYDLGMVTMIWDFQFMETKLIKLLCVKSMCRNHAIYDIVTYTFDKHLELEIDCKALNVKLKRLVNTQITLEIRGKLLKTIN